MSAEPALRVLVGGTASGKKAVAAELHARHGWRLLSMDSMKVYRGMDIGTDKPSAELLARAPFALLDLAGHDERFSAGDWLRAAQAEARRPGAPVLFAGGTPLYLRLLLRGLCPSPPADPALRADLEADWAARGEAALRAELRAVDPLADARLLPHDRKRVLRALEVARLTGRPLSEWQREHTRPPWPGRVAVAALRREPREQERRRVARVDRMLAAGLLDEVRGLLARAPFAAEPSRAIGYREALEHLAGRLDAPGLRERMLVRTRQLVRKQRLHLQGLAEVRWIDVGEADTVAQVAAQVERALEA